MQFARVPLPFSWFKSERSVRILSLWISGSPPEKSATVAAYSCPSETCIKRVPVSRSQIHPLTPFPSPPPSRRHFTPVKRAPGELQLKRNPLKAPSTSFSTWRALRGRKSFAKRATTLLAAVPNHRCIVSAHGSTIATPPALERGLFELCVLESGGIGAGFEPGN